VTEHGTRILAIDVVEEVAQLFFAGVELRRRPHPAPPQSLEVEGQTAAAEQRVLQAGILGSQRGIARDVVVADGHVGDAHHEEAGFLHLGAQRGVPLLTERVACRDRQLVRSGGKQPSEVERAGTVQRDIAIGDAHVDTRRDPGGVQAHAPAAHRNVLEAQAIVTGRTHALEGSLRRRCDALAVSSCRHELDPAGRRLVHARVVVVDAQDVQKRAFGNDVDPGVEPTVPLDVLLRLQAAPRQRAQRPRQVRIRAAVERQLPGAHEGGVVRRHREAGRSSALGLDREHIGAAHIQAWRLCTRVRDRPHAATPGQGDNAGAGHDGHCGTCGSVVRRRLRSHRRAAWPRRGCNGQSGMPAAAVIAGGHGASAGLPCRGRATGQRRCRGAEAVDRYVDVHRIGSVAGSRLVPHPRRFGRRPGAHRDVDAAVPLTSQRREVVVDGARRAEAAHDEDRVGQAREAL
jgi:hypothetical protein